jgi:predicted acetyltransferase
MRRGRSRRQVFEPPISPNPIAHQIDVVLQAEIEDANQIFTLEQHRFANVTPRNDPREVDVAIKQLRFLYTRLDKNMHQIRASVGDFSP